MGKLFQTKEHGANIKPKEMLNYLEGGSEGSLSNEYKNTFGNTNEKYKNTFGNTNEKYKNTIVHVFLYDCWDGWDGGAMQEN